MGKQWKQWLTLFLGAPKSLAETAVSSDSHIQIGGLTSAILIVLGGVSLKFQGL